MRQTVHVQVAHGVAATLEYWPAATLSRTLLLYSHGMQEPAFLEAPNIAPKNYAFTIPFDRALINPSFTQPVNAENFETFADTFVRYPGQFNSRTPRLYIYPYLNAQLPPIDVALDTLDARDVCDLMYLTDLTMGTDYIRLEQLVSAVHPRGGTLHTTYDSFLLVACRSSTMGRVIGFGGAVGEEPDGLYKGDDTFIMKW